MADSLGVPRTRSVKASRRWFEGDQRTIARERSQGVFTRQIQLSDSLDTDKVDAQLDAGVLTLTIPVKESSQPRTIGIKTLSGVTDRELTTTSS